MKTSKILMVILVLAFSLIRVAWAGGDQESDKISALQLTYFKAVQNNDFSTAYDMVTDNMKDGRSREKYVEDWENIMKSGQVDIVDGGVISIEVNGSSAKVLAWSKASDVFNVIPIIEKEIDTWLLVDGVWKLDSTEVLMEEVTDIPTD